MNPPRSSRLPAEVHTDRRLSAEPPKFRHEAPPREPQRVIPVIWHRRVDLRRGAICLALAAVLCIALILALRVTFKGAGSADGSGQGSLQGGLPPTGAPNADSVISETDSAAETADVTDPADTADIVETQPQDPTDDTDSPETEEAPPSESDTEDVREPVTQPADDGTDETTDEPATDQPSSEPEDSDTSAETDPVVKPEATTPVPAGCYPIVSMDVSQADRGAGHVVGNLENLPSILPDGGLWGTEGAPTVLIVNTHPYEGYGDGGAWYDPDEGGLALTDTPNAADGAVALGAEMARTLRGMGVTVIHLRIAVSAEDSASNIYERTETVIRSYCRLYPDIGLVLDLRRSAELTEDGGILRTVGSFEGNTCAQARISVSGGREKTAFARDLAVALALREGMWGMEPSVSRPVRVKTGSGLVGDLNEVCVLTLELGSAGNTYAEAVRLTAPLAAVLSGLVLDGA